MGADGESVWPDEARSAISLTFDGGLPEHLELVFPILEEHEVKATFFVTPPALLENPVAWKKVAQAGHEIGSHSFYKATDDGSLVAWTLDMVREDLRMTEKGIAEICEVPVASFALPGEKTECAEGDYMAVLSRLYSYIRSPLSHPNLAETFDPHKIGSLFWRDLVGPVEAFLPSEDNWNVVVFEPFFEVGAEAAEDDLRFLLAHLAKRKDIWVAPMGVVGQQLKPSR